MRFSIIFILTTLCVLAVSVDNNNNLSKSKQKGKLRKRKETSYDIANDEELVPLNIIFVGNLRKYFAFLAALEPPLKSSVCSPLSALLPLGKLALGANAKTLVELLKAVGATQLSELRQRFKTLIHSLQKLSGVDLDIASRVYVNDEVRISESYTADTNKVFNSSVVQMDFSNPKEVVETINKWVERETHNKIKDLLSPAMISKQVSLVLVNAVYFMGKWEKKFDSVSIEKFYSPMGELKIPMMHRTGDYMYAKDTLTDSEVIEIPYNGRKASFVLVLPRQRGGLTTLLTALKLSPDLLNNALKKMKSSYIALSMPKFKIESSWDLAKSYKQLGLKEIFSGGEGMTLIQKKHTTYVSAAVQKAFIEVDEQGTTAAASSESKCKSLDAGSAGPVVVEILEEAFVQQWTSFG